MATKGRLIVVTGPSGVGKTTLLKKMLESHKKEMCFSVSHTSRAARNGEKEGIDYHFVSKEEFEKGIKNKIFLEYAEVHGNLYGTSKKCVDDILCSHKYCLLDIDVQGGLTLMSKNIDALYIFIAPTNLEVLKERLKKRAADTDEVIQKRVNVASDELKHKDKYDHVVVNDELEKAYNELEEIIF